MIQDYKVSIRQAAQSTLTNIKEISAKLESIQYELHNARNNLSRYQSHPEDVSHLYTNQPAIQRLAKLSQDKTNLQKELAKASADGREGILRQINHLETEIAALRDNISNASENSEITGDGTMTNDMNNLNSMVREYNRAVRNAADAARKLGVLDLDIAEVGDEVDLEKAEEDARKAIQTIRDLEAKVKDLEEQKRKLIPVRTRDGKLTRNRDITPPKPIDPNDPEFDLFRKPAEAAPEAPAEEPAAEAVEEARLPDKEQAVKTMEKERVKLDKAQAKQDKRDAANNIKWAKGEINDLFGMVKSAIKKGEGSMHTIIYNAFRAGDVEEFKQKILDTFESKGYDVKFECIMSSKDKEARAWDGDKRVLPLTIT